MTGQFPESIIIAESIIIVPQKWGQGTKQIEGVDSQAVEVVKVFSKDDKTT